MNLSDSLLTQPAWDVLAELPLVHYRNSDTSAPHLPLEKPFLPAVDRLTYILAGSMTMSVNLHPAELGAGHVLYTAQGSIVVVQSESPDLELYSCSLLAKPLGMSHPHHRFFSPSPALDRRLHTYFTLLGQLGDSSAAVLMPLHQAMLADLFTDGQAVDVADFSTHEHRIFNRFIELVADHALTERRVDFYAERLNISTSRLMSIVRRLSGRTVLQWINLRALLQSKALLVYSDKTVSEVALEVGMADSNYFSRFFRSETGFTPTEYRQSQRTASVERRV